MIWKSWVRTTVRFCLSTTWTKNIVLLDCALYNANAHHIPNMTFIYVFRSNSSVTNTQISMQWRRKAATCSDSKWQKPVQNWLGPWQILFPHWKAIFQCNQMTLWRHLAFSSIFLCCCAQPFILFIIHSIKNINPRLCKRGERYFLHRMIEGIF